MNIGTWFNVYVFDRHPKLENIRCFVDGYLLGELRWRMRELVGAGQYYWVNDPMGSTYSGMMLTLEQPFKHIRHFRW